MKKFIRLANKEAASSKHEQHMMACVVVRGGAILSMEANGAAGRGHAEARAIRPHGDYKGATAYIVRLNGRRTSKPCPGCTKILKEAGVAAVVFTDTDGIEKNMAPSQIKHSVEW
jgi:pyrimidine deaminase RibD-like protein